MSFKLLLVDDEDRTGLAQQIRDLGDGEFEVEAIPPPVDLTLGETHEIGADLSLVDYELDTSQPGRSVAPYRGMTLAARLREVRPGYPIALLTRSNLPSWMDAEKTARAGAPFDGVVYKDEHLRKNPAATRARLLSLARGYRTLRDTSGRAIADLLRMLETDAGGREIAQETFPPGDDWKEFEAAHWIRSVLLRYPGVLYDKAHAATALGISAESFQEEAIQEMLQAAEYRGPFSEEARRWWRHTLFDIGHQLCGDAGIERGLREVYYLAASEALELTVTRSMDVESGLSPADTVCQLLGVPIRFETSLPYQPDSRPPVMDRARISFKAIRESNDVEEIYIDAASRACLQDIRASG